MLIRHQLSRVCSVHLRQYHFYVAAHAREKSVDDRPRHRKLLRLDPASSVAAWHKQLLASYPDIYSTGEDCFFVKKAAHNKGVFLGVCDGVGGWTDNGVDPSAFSQGLSYYLSQRVDTLDKDGRAAIDIETRQLLSLAYQDVLNDQAVVAGSSTVVVASLRAEDGYLRAANLGDSSFAIYRKGEIIYMQAPQTYYFNAPFQLAKVPATFNQSAILSNKPGQAITVEMQLQDQDVLLLLTDGITDNVFPHTLADIVKRIQDDKTKSKDQQSRLMALGITDYAFNASTDPYKLTPFSLEAEKAGFDYPGGKQDDMTVVLAQVEENEVLE